MTEPVYIYVVNIVLLLISVCIGFDAEVFKFVSHILHIGSKRENAVAVSKTKALTSLHGDASLHQEVELLDCRGMRRRGIITFVQFAENVVDIALIELIGDRSFEFYIPVFKGKVALGMEFHVLGCTTSLVGDETLAYYESGKIISVEPTTLVRASYYSEDGISGAGIIVAVEHGSFHVLGAMKQFLRRKLRDTNQVPHLKTVYLRIAV